MRFVPIIVAVWCVSFALFRQGPPAEPADPPNWEKYHNGYFEEARRDQIERDKRQERQERFSRQERASRYFHHYVKHKKLGAVATVEAYAHMEAIRQGWSHTPTPAECTYRKGRNEYDPLVVSYGSSELYRFHDSGQQYELERAGLFGSAERVERVNMILEMFGHNRGK